MKTAGRHHSTKRKTGSSAALHAPRQNERETQLTPSEADAQRHLDDARVAGGDDLPELRGKPPDSVFPTKCAERMHCSVRYFLVQF